MVSQFVHLVYELVNSLTDFSHVDPVLLFKACVFHDSLKRWDEFPMLWELVFRRLFISINEIFDFTVLGGESLESFSDRFLKVCLLVSFGLNVENKVVVSSVDLT